MTPIDINERDQPAWQRATIAFFLLSILALCLSIYRNLPEDLTGYFTATESLLAQLDRRDDKEFAFTPEDFPFDPNTVTEAELLRLGVPARRAVSWLKYRGDRPRAFNKPEDIGKLYGLDTDLKERLIGLAVVPPKVTPPPRPAESFAFDVNDVTQSDLERLGLKAYQSKAFLSYRSKIDGGFTRPSQLARLKFLDTEQRDHLLANAQFPEPKPLSLKGNFKFDPNLISADSLELLGFPAYQARALVRYRGDRRVTFRKPEDLFRVRSLDSNLLVQALPRVRITVPKASEGGKAAPKPKNFPPKPLPELASIDLNVADTSVLKSLPGIGSYRAKRLVRYRELLGGFYSLDQAATTRGIPDTTWVAIAPFLRLGPVFRRLNVNKASVAELKSHPSINSNLAGAVVRFREKHGPFRDERDLKQVRLLTKAKLSTILPYLTFE